MILRQVTPADLPAVMKIEGASFLPAIQERREVFAERISVCPSCFIMFEDDIMHEAAGYFSAERWAALPAENDIFTLNHSARAAYTPEGSVIYLSSFAILPQFRGQGRGRELFEQSISWFSAHNSGLTDAVLLVNEAWKSAAHIYSSYGFRETRRIPAFFPSENGSDTDGIIMEKKLSIC